MTTQAAKPFQVTLIVAGVIAVLIALNVVIARPWDTNRNALCEVLAENHIQARTQYLEAVTDSDNEVLYTKQNASFDVLGQTCGWEQAQAADMQARVVLES